MFQMFSSDKVDGTGLGLAISREIVLAHGGAIEHRRDDGQTIFEITLPAA